MTTLTQSDLDDLRQMAMAHQGTELLGVSKEMALFLINRIAQLTVERDEAQRLAATHFNNKTVVERELNAATARIAELESECDQLRKQVEGLKEALKPFLPHNQQIASILFGHLPDDEPANVTVRLGDLRRAASALEQKEQG